METSQGGLCVCNAGYEENQSGDCVDINECLSNPCGENSRCLNQPGYHQCVCNEGYVREGAGCVGKYPQLY